MDDDWIKTEEERLEGRIKIAKELIENFISWGFLKHGPDWTMAFPKYWLRVSDEHGCLMIPQSHLDAFIQAARETPDIFDLAMHIASQRLPAGVGIPEPLMRLTSEHLDREFSRPAARRGRSKKWGRDAIIIEAMRWLIAGFEIPATCRHDLRGVRNRSVSASEIVFEALKRTEIGYVDLKRIHGIWNSMSNDPDLYHAGASYAWSFLAKNWDGLNRSDWV